MAFGCTTSPSQKIPTRSRFKRIEEILSAFRRNNPIGLGLSVTALVFAVVAVTAAWYGNVLAEKGNQLAFQSLQCAANSCDMENGTRIGLREFSEWARENMKK